MEYVSGNIFIRQMTFGALGTVVDGHSHNFDHTTYVIRGSVLVERLAADGTVEASVVKTARQGYNWVLIKAGHKHRLTSLEEDTEAHCIYSHRLPQGLVDWGGNDAEYDAKLAELQTLANQRFGQIVQEFDGWTPGYQ